MRERQKEEVASKTLHKMMTQSTTAECIEPHEKVQQKWTEIDFAYFCNTAKK